MERPKVLRRIGVFGSAITAIGLAIAVIVGVVIVTVHRDFKKSAGPDDALLVRSEASSGQQKGHNGTPSSKPDPSLFDTGHEYRSPGPHKVVVYDPYTPDDVEGFKPVMYGPGFVVGLVEDLPAEQPGAVEVRDDWNILRLRRAPFDSTIGEPDIQHPGRRAEQHGERSLVLVQAPGPIHDAWVSEIRSLGIEPVSYLPENAFIALAGEDGVERLRALEADYRVQFVGSYHPGYAIDESLANASGSQNVAFLIPATPEGDEVRRKIDFGANSPPKVVEVGALKVVLANIDAAIARDVVADGPVIYAELLPEPRLSDERSARWIAGFRTPDRSNAVLGSGYLSWYASKGFGGNPGFAVDIADSGLGSGGTISPGSVHPDYLDASGNVRVQAAFNYTSDASVADVVGHGTAVGGVIAGRNAGSGSSVEDSDGFNYGVGVDPEARLVISKAFTASPSGVFTNYLVDGPGNAYRAGARISNASWGAPISEYNILSFLFDSYTHDVLPDAGRQEMAFVFAAGNAGPGAGSIESPANAKNVIAVGAHENNRPGWVDDCDTSLGQFSTPNVLADDMDDVSHFSGRGPTADGRTKPDLVAPGIHITSAFGASGVCANSGLPGGFSGYTSATGTSFAAPHVSGTLSLIRRWFSQRGWKAPSPAMLKAYLATGSVYLQGTGAGGNLPNNDQGFGAAALESLLTDTTKPLQDQSFVFTDTGQQYEIQAAVADSSKPLVVTLAYSDALGSTAGAAFVNDLDLEVVVGGNLYRGNVTSGQYSVSGGLADDRNNLERVLLPAGQSGPVTVRVKAKRIAGDGVPNNVDASDQDFALVVSNVSDSTMLTVESIDLFDLADANGSLGSPEPFAIHATVRNLGSSTAFSVTGVLSTSSAGTSLSSALSSFGNIVAGGTAQNAVAFSGLYEGNCTSDVAFTLTLTSGSKSYQHRFTVPGDSHPDPVKKDFNIPIQDGRMIEGGFDIFQGGVVLDVDVFVSVSHQALGELVVTLRSPQGTEIVLSNRRGSSRSGLFVSFDDDAPQPISAADTSASDPIIGSFRPDQALASFNGQSAAGVWILRIYDQVFSGSGSQGTLLSAEIKVTTGCLQPACTVRPSSPVSTGYLAEGATAGGFDTWVLLANPGSQKVAACMTFLTEFGAVPGPLVSLPPLSRKSVLVDWWVTSFNVATVVEGVDGQVLAERAMYSTQPGLQGAHSVKATSQTATEWFLAEGATSGPFETWVLVANPSATQSANVSLTYMTSDGPRPGPSIFLGPQARQSVRVDDAVDTYHVSTFVSSSGAPVVAERATYVSPGERQGATASPGVTTASTKSYLAEGATTGGFETWILLANPSATESVSASVNFLTESGAGASVPVSLAPRSRQSIRANDYVSSFNVSTVVDSSGPGAVAERAMYFDHPTLGKGAASGEAVVVSGSEWMAVEGATSGGFETWILVANPDPTNAVSVQVEFLSTGGVAASTTFSIPANSRRSIKANDYLDSYDVTTRVRVQGGGAVFVERATYTPSGPSRDATASPAFRIA